MKRPTLIKRCLRRSPPRSVRTVGVILLATGLALGLSTTAASARTPSRVEHVSAEALSSAPLAADSSWKRYVLGNGQADVYPQKVTATDGDVSDANSLVRGSGQGTKGSGRATLTYNGTGPYPSILLDYGKDVGGFPFFDITSGTAGATLKAFYSESKHFMYTPGSTTLASGAAGGATNIKVAAVTQTVDGTTVTPWAVGDTLTIGTETAKIVSVGTAAAEPVLVVAASAGATNLKVSSVADISVGDAITVDPGGSNPEAETITSIGTAGASTVLSAAASAGATSIAVQSSSNFHVGDIITIDTGAAQETATVAAVAAGSRGAPSTVTLAAPLAFAHASGATVVDPGTGIGISTPLAYSHAAGATVSDLGTGISFQPALTTAQAAGTAVTSSPGALTGDSTNNQPTAGSNDSRIESFTLTGGAQTISDTLIQGGQRFEAIELTTPGTVTVSLVGTKVDFDNAGPSGYSGYFLSSDNELNRIWFDGAYTDQLDTVPAGTDNDNTNDLIFDGAKRDRKVWSGDLGVEGVTMFETLGPKKDLFGNEGNAYIEGSIKDIADLQASTGATDGQVSPGPDPGSSGSFWSVSYSMDYVLDLVNYYRYTGNTSFAEAEYQVMKNELNYNATMVSPTTGLLTLATPGNDWDFYDGGKSGAVSEFNVIYYRALTQAAYLATQIAAADPANPDVPTWKSDAATWTSQAAALKAALDNPANGLWNPTTGTFNLAATNEGAHPADTIPQDANSMAVWWGANPPGTSAGVLAALKSTLWTPNGAEPFSIISPATGGFDPRESPYITGYEVNATLSAGDTADGLTLIRNMWGPMSDPSNANYTGAFWEWVEPNGTVGTDPEVSLAHGWATGPVGALSNYILGLQAVDAGYKTWTIAPQTGDLKFAQGQVPTMSGAPLVSRWQVGTGNSSFELTMSAPRGTTGTVAVPELGAARDIAMDGRLVWKDGAPVGGVSATEQNGEVLFSDVTGAHTFAWVANG